MASDSAPDPAEFPRPSPAELAGPRHNRDARNCDLGVLMANSLEAGCLEDRLVAAITVRGEGLVVRRGGLRGSQVAVMIAGAKPRQATRGAEALIFGHGPRLVVAAGFASALSDRLQRGDLVVAESILGVTRELLPLVRTLDRDLANATPRLFVGRLLSLAQPIHRPAEKRALGIEHAALAADRQSLEVAKVCRNENIPFLAVRVIVDTVNDEVPPEVRQLTSRKTAARRIGAVAGSLIRRPSAIKDLWNAYEISLAAAETLAKFIEAVVASRRGRSSSSAGAK